MYKAYRIVLNFCIFFQNAGKNATSGRFGGIPFRSEISFSGHLSQGPTPLAARLEGPHQPRHPCKYADAPRPSSALRAPSPGGRLFSGLQKPPHPCKYGGTVGNAFMHSVKNPQAYGCSKRAILESPLRWRNHRWIAVRRGLAPAENAALAEDSRATARVAPTNGVRFSGRDGGAYRCTEI